MSKRLYSSILTKICFAGGRIAQYIHQIACIEIVVPQQKWKNTYLETIPI